MEKEFNEKVQKKFEQIKENISEKTEEIKENISEKKTEIKENISEKKTEIKEEIKKKKEYTKPLVVCRYLFYSVLDIILLIFIALSYFVTVYNAFFKTNGIGNMITSFIMGTIGTVIMYLFLNWLYKCVVKSMLSVTDKELRIEKYYPFRDINTTIPLNKITGITTTNVFWIFRIITIHQYGKLPTIFPTWNNKEMKAKLVELISKENKDVLNDAKGRDLIDKKDYKKVLTVVGLIVAAMFALAVILSIFKSFGNMKYSGKYSRVYYGTTYVLDLKANGTCSWSELLYNNNSCTWEGYKENGQLKAKINSSYEVVLDKKSKTYSR